MNTDHDRDMIFQIVDRAVAMSRKFSRRPIRRVDVLLSIRAAHADCPMRLRDLLDANDANFAHDIFGILRHINPATGKLTDGFVPRFCQRKDAVAS